MNTHDQVLVSLRKIIRAIDLHSKRLEREQTLILSSLQRVADMMNATDLDAVPLLDSSDAQVIAKSDA